MTWQASSVAHFIQSIRFSWPYRIVANASLLAFYDLIFNMFQTIIVSSLEHEARKLPL